MKNSFKKILVSLFAILLLIIIIPSNIIKAEDEEVIEENETQETNTEEEKVNESFSYPLTYRDIDIVDSSKFIVKKENLLKASPISGIRKFDLRNVNGKNYVTPVKDQGNYGICWAYSILASAESTYLKKNNISLDLSEVQLAYFTYHNHNIEDKLKLVTKDGFIVPDEDYGTNLFQKGGNNYIASFLLASGIGPLKDQKMSTNSLLTGEYLSNASFIKKLKSNYKDYCYKLNDYYVVETYWFNMEDIDTVKEAIYNNGAVASSYYHNEYDIYDPDYYNPETYAYYNYREDITNHAITIVGWDDDFSKNNFINKPNNNGAWLVKNSWGLDSEYTDSNGYFWISYEDKGLLYSDSTCQFIIENAEDMNLYQYDGTYAGWYYYDEYHPNYYKAGNIYKASRKEKINKVGYYTACPNITTKIYIYKNVKNDPEDGVLIGSFSVNDKYAGYHTYEINKDVLISKGQKFSIVIEQQNNDGEALLMMSANYSNSWYDAIDNTSPNQSFIYQKKNENDTYHWEDLHYDSDGPFTATIKAYTKASNHKEPVVDFVTRLYNLCLNRQPDYDGLFYYVEKLQDGTFTAAQVVKNFYNSPEMKKLNLSDNEFIERCYKAMMDRSSDAGGLKYWKDILDKGVSRIFVVKGFVESPEFTNICNNYKVTKGEVSTDESRDINIGITSFVTRCYTKALGRKYDIDGLNYHTAKILNSSNKKQTALDTASNGFFHSPEFLNKNTSSSEFIKICYRTFLDREAEASGLQYYLNRLNSGESRDTLLSNFANSPEFINLLASYGIK